MDPPGTSIGLPAHPGPSPSSPARPSKPSKRGKNVEQHRYSVGQMDPKLAFDQLQSINIMQDLIERKLQSSDYAQHLQRLLTYRNKNMTLSVDEAVQRLRRNEKTAYTTLSSLITKRRRDEYFTSGSVLRRLRKRKDLQDKITALRRNIIEREANSADDERSKLWRQICRKQIPKAAKQMAASYSNRLSNARRTAVFCIRETKKMWTRQGRLAKECAVRARKQMREMLLFWRKNEREERDARKRAEKEAAEQRRLEEEQREARRQAKKLNFLLTQTELFSHFVASKDKNANVPAGTTAKIQAGVDFADVDDETLRAQAEQMARNAAERTRAQRDAFNTDTSASGGSRELDFSKADVQQTVLQPRMLQATLKEYQLLGLSWMANLYEQGINGILADEMGLGKTIQAIALLAHLAETHNIWGPFLVVAPASTLHNWQQELARFVPAFKVLPYWGSVADRKTLRKFWPSSSKRPFARDSTFHVMVTSYQLVVTDQAFLQKVRWQYMVLDEAQAIKSSSSQRWNVLLGFQCRNRLLLTGTPIQNTMQELWALLHFIMPSLFDSHDEFSDWFSKDIESQAATDAGGRGTGMAGFDHHQLARLHMILKPFMLRRVKKDVQSELAPKVELEVLCDMAPKQRRLYRAIKQRLPVAELLRSVNSDSEASASLMNLVMQFRKVCNHPELFERDPIVSPLVLSVSPDPHTEKTSGRLVWPGPLRSNLDIEIPRDCLVDDTLATIVVDKPQCPALEILTRPVLDLSDELVPVSVRFVTERLPRAYIPSAIAPPVSPSLHPSLSLMTEDCYSTGRQILVPDLHPGIQDCGKLARLDSLLAELKAGGHRVLLYNQMTRMIDLMEEYLQFRKYRYLRLDGSTRIADRRDMVTAWQTNPDIFIFLLSTRAGGLGINLTAADTVIFYDSDWNPTVDQQAMDRAHRLGQQKQVTVYRMVTRGSIEERIQQRAHQKDLVQKVVIAGGDFGEGGPPTAMRARDVASLLLDEDDI